MSDPTQSYKTPSLVAVLLSGGIDSTAALMLANQLATDNELPLHAISFNYGQRHQKELEAAAAICHEVDAKHHILDIAGIVPRTMLTGEGEVPNISYADITGVSPTYVPYRNGLMMSAAASFIDGLLKEIDGHTAQLFCGIHADDSAGYAYPDCTPEFWGSQANAIFTGTYGRVRLVAPFLFNTKAQIVGIGDDLNAPWHLTWSCYKGEELHCGVCPTCRARKEAFELVGAEDPTEYAA
jgi:7-cyano-7-deazaguanine synthase